ncbi:MAG: HD domain-containing protein [Acidobacteria bacterium]|nr:HD domain-containing protein [Acidobacteriota bacterium]
MSAIDPLILEICRSVRDAGGRALLVGGWVRDLEALRLQGRPGVPATGEYDLEVYHLPAGRLAALLGRFGEVKLVGQSFAVYKLVPPPSGLPPAGIDVSLPRRDTKVAPGHRGFAVSGDPDLSLQEASRRRDFTVNAMLFDPLAGDTIDPWGGREDLRAGLLRAVDPATFIEDSLRVLRAVQFAARFEFAVEAGTVDLCRRIDLSDLPAERIWGEIEKLLLRAARPSAGLDWADRLGVVDRLFPELRALKGCPQEPEWHPEGDVWIHTLMAVDVAKAEIADLPKEKALAVLLAVLCHDFGKPGTTAVVDGRIRSYDHEEAGIAPARAFLDRLNVRSLHGYDLREQVVQLVAHHLTPSHYYKNRDNVGDGAFRRLARRLEPDLLYRVSRADCLGRTGSFSTEAQEWFIAKVRGLSVESRPPAPILMGRHLLGMGLPPCPAVGRIVRAVYEMQLDGRVATLEEAKREARVLIEAERAAGSLS